jgi:putative transposase
LAQRNCYGHRIWENRVSTVALRIPKLRKGSYLPSFLEPRRIAEKALAAVVQEAYVRGVSPARSGARERLSGISNSQVSRLCGEIDDKVKAFSRPSDRG